MQNIRKRIGRLGSGLLLLVGLLVLGGCGEGNPPPASSPEPAEPAGKTAAPRDGVIVAVGDSLTAGYRVAEEHAYPAILQQRLDQDGYNYQVVNSGISGETSSGTLSRLDWVLTLKPDIIILETGANDGLRGIDLQLTRENLDRIVIRLRDAGIIVVLAGMKMVKNLGEPFTREFENLYPAIAAKHDLILIPFFLEGVAAQRQLNQADGIHPTEQGYRKVVEQLYPFVVKAIERHRQG